MQRGRRFDFPLASPLAFAAVTVTALLAAAFPLTGSPGPEAAQLLSAVGGPTLLLAGAARGAKRHDRGFFGDLLNQSLLVAACMISFATVVTLASWGNPSCAPGRGYLPFVFLSLPVLCLDGAIGLWIGRLTGGLRLALLASLAFLVGYVAWAAVDWYVDPSFRVLTHLLVLIEGDLIAGRDVSPTGVAYRMATLLFAGGLSAWGMATFPRSKRAPGLGGGVSSPTALIAGAVVLVLVGAVVHLKAADALDPDRGDLEETYTLEKKRGALVVHADPAVTTVREVDAILAEGDLWLTRLAKRMGVTPDEEVHIFLHASSAAMGAWTGAENVHFALPERNELHISGAEVPHPTLGHELAHVLGRELADSFLGVPTSFGIPNTGLIEGLAMAMTPELEAGYGLTLREQAAALEQAKLAPPVEELFDEHFSFFGFWRHSPGNSYTIAGALVEALAAATGQEGIARMYEEGTLRAAFDSDGALASFLAEHTQSLRRAELPKDAIPFVKRSTLARPSILSETCDPEAASIAEAVRSAARAGDFDTAEALAAEAEGDLSSGTLLALARAASDVQRPARALQYLLRRSEAPDTDAARERAIRLDTAADALWRAGRQREAAVTWARVDTAVMPVWRQRMVSAKELLSEAAIARPSDRELALAGLDLLLSSGETNDLVPQVARIAGLLGRADAGGSSESDRVVTFARYLLVLQYLQRGALDAGLELALRVWDERDALDLPFEQNLLGAIAVGHARRGDAAIAKVGFESLAGTLERAADRVRMNDRAERVGRMMLADDADPEKAGDRWLLGLSRSGAL